MYASLVVPPSHLNRWEDISDIGETMQNKWRHRQRLSVLNPAIGVVYFYKRQIGLNWQMINNKRSSKILSSGAQ